MQRQLQVHIPADTGCGISMGELFPGTNADPVADDDICAFIDEGEQTLTCVEVDNVVLVNKENIGPGSMCEPRISRDR